MSENALTERILAVAQRAGSSPFLRLLSSDEVPLELSYLTLMQQASVWSQLYKAHGLKKRHRVIVLLRHSADLYAAFVGAITGGMVPAILAPPSPKLSREQFQKTMRALLPTAQADALVVGAELIELLPAGRDFKVITTREAFGSPPENLMLDPSGSGDDTAFLQYSSGTTGLRKGVTISHAACLRQVDAYASAIGLNATDSIVSWLPLYHDMGLIACLMLPLLTGTPVTAMSPFDWVARPAMLTRAIREHRPTLCWLPNFAFLHLARSVPESAIGSGDLGSVRAFVNCSEPITDHAHQRFLARFARAGVAADRLATCYAMAETTFAVTSSKVGSPPATLAVDPSTLGLGADVLPGAHVLVASGRPIGETRVRIADSRGASLPDRRVGEIRVSSSSLTKGYLANPKATRAVLSRGELATGDLGFLDDGELFVLGRQDDLIITTGRNLYPQDIEAVVESIPGAIAGRSVAFGVDESEDGTAHLVVIAETDEQDVETRRTLARRLSSELVARLDVAPREVCVVDRGWLLKSTSGKMSRRLNRDRYLSERVQQAPPPTTSDLKMERLPLEEFVRAAVRTVLRGSPPGDDESLLISGRLDSLSFTTLLLALGERFGERLPMPNVVGFDRFDTIRSLLGLLHDVERGFRAQSRDAVYSAREVKLRCLGESSKRLDLVVLGSSTAFAIPCRPSAVGGQAAFNLSVNAASIADLYCLMRLAMDRRGPLQRVMIGLDVFALKPRDALVLEHRTVNLPELTRYLAPQDRDLIDQLRDAAVRSSQGQRVNLQRMAEWEPGRHYGFDQETGDILFEGGHSSRRSVTDRPRDFAPQMHEMTLIYNGYDRLCPRQSDYLREIAATTAADGITLDLVVMPLHPELLKFLENSTYPERRSDLVRLISSFSSPSVRLHDLELPADFGGDELDFEDAYHLGGRNSEMLLKYVLTR